MLRKDQEPRPVINTKTGDLTDSVEKKILTFLIGLYFMEEGKIKPKKEE